MNSHRENVSGSRSSIIQDEEDSISHFSPEKEGVRQHNELEKYPKGLIMWDVFMEILLVAGGKLNSGDNTQISWTSTKFVEQAWQRMGEKLTRAIFSKTREILESEPPKWLPDGSVSSCMLCSTHFHPYMCRRHHCRFCGGIFCNDCSKGRSLLPENFHIGIPKRVYDVCCVRLEYVQLYLLNHVRRAAQTDLSTLKSWLNTPWGQSMEYEVCKAAITIRSYAESSIDGAASRVGFRQEKRIPEAILRDAKGLAILTVVKVGMVVNYSIGTGVVVARRKDGSWSPPSAISSFGFGWEAQADGELADLIVVLRTYDEVKSFCSEVHDSVAAGVSAFIGIIRRSEEEEADAVAGDGGFAACSAYCCRKGSFIEWSFEGSVVATRSLQNSRFYGKQSLSTSEIVLGSLPRPPAAATLYHALEDLFVEVRGDRHA